MKPFTSINFSSRPKIFFSRTKALSWFDADLQIMSICKLKFNLLPMWTPNILTCETTLMFFCQLWYFYSDTNWSYSCNKSAWNLARLITLLTLNQLIAQPLSDYKMHTRLFMVSIKLCNLFIISSMIIPCVLSSAKL